MLEVTPVPSSTTVVVGGPSDFVAGIRQNVYLHEDLYQES